MKIHSVILALCLSLGSVWGTTAFSFQPQSKASPVVLGALAPSSESAYQLSSFAPPAPASGSSYELAAPETPSDDWFPVDLTMHTIQGGESLATYAMPVWAERVQMVFKTDGRPMKARAQLWLGPLRNTHTLEINSMDGNLTPVRATLKFKSGGQVLRVGTTAGYEFPMLAGVFVPSPKRSAELAANTEKVWKMSPKQRVQGGSIKGGGGAVRTWTFGEEVESIQILCWAKDVGKKSFKMDIEIYQGPGEAKQKYFLQCGGGSQPYHAVFELPEGGSMIRLKNKKFVEDGLFEAAVVPFKIRDA